jgi:hypothetical protein
MAQTKEQLIEYFNSLDLSTLQKLQRYSQFLIIPEEDLLTNVTMIQMVDKANSLADSLFPQWTDRSKSDFGMFLVELMALFSEKDFWYINAFANESILRKMRSYSNAFSRASSMGYIPTTCKGASATFSLQFVAGEEVTYERGDVTIAVGGIEFTNDEAFTVEISSAELSKQVILKEGTHIAEDVTYNGHNIFLSKKNIDIDSIYVIIDNIRYTRVNNFGRSSSDSPHYIALPEENGEVTIYFGSDGYGLTPATGKLIRVGYRTTIGSKGNMDTNVAVVHDSLPERPILSALMVTPALNGADPEPLSAIKEKAPLYFGTKRAAINEKVAEQILKGFSFVHQAKVVLSGREVIYYVIPKGVSDNLTVSEIAILAEDFHPTLMAGYVGRYVDNNYVNLLEKISLTATKVVVEVIVAYGTNMSTVTEGVTRVIQDFTNPRINAKYGGNFIKANVEMAIRTSLTGIQSVAFKYFDGTEKILPDVYLSETEIFRTTPSEAITVRVNAI